MKKSTWIIRLLAWLFFIATMAISPSLAADEPGVVVGRIYHIEGELLRYVPEEHDWAVLVKDAPFGAQDALFSDAQGLAELIVPNGTWVRIGNNTQIQFIALQADLSEADVAAGVARFYNKSSDALVKATSPFGYVLADPGTVFDFYVGENSVEVLAVKGTVSFIHAATDARYDVAAGAPSILADHSQVALSQEGVDPDWDQWNRSRESFWAAKAKVRGRSAEYLPSRLRDEAYVFEECGVWERVYYEGGFRWLWRPTIVAVGWSPFTVGRWTYWCEDQCWIPAEPFGYVTHHYGNWVYLGNFWYWAPPVVSVSVGLPSFYIGSWWYPGRVSWIYYGAYVGWAPLAPYEIYYCHRHWGGPHTVVVNNVDITQININVQNLVYINHAVVVHQNHFCHVNSYRGVRAKVSRFSVTKYRGAPVVDNAVISNYSKDKQRYNFTNVPLKAKPRNAVLDRIRHNEASIEQSGHENAAVIRDRAKSVRPGKVNREARIAPPKSANYMVPANKADQPEAEIKGGRNKIQPVPSARSGGSQRVLPVRPSPPERAKPERILPSRPSRQEESGHGVDERVLPARPALPERPRPERVLPARPGRQEDAGDNRGSGYAAPARPAPPAQISPESAAPSRPGRWGRSGKDSVPTPVIPAQPPAPEPTRIKRPAPTKPGQEAAPVQPETEKIEKPVENSSSWKNPGRQNRWNER